MITSPAIALARSSKAAPSGYRCYSSYRFRDIIRLVFTGRQQVTSSKIIQPASRDNPPSMAELKTLQRCFGLKPPAVTWQEDNYDQPWQSVSERPRYGAEADVVFICVDLEAYEFAQDKITEVGVAILDTRNVTSLPPGDGVTDWLAEITSKHIRIAEFKHLVNKRFIHGCPDKFNFGHSQLVGLQDVGQVLKEAFSSGMSSSADRRNVVLVGHDVGRDVKYLAQLGFNPSQNANIVNTMDTQRFCGSTKKSPVGLAKLLLALEIDARNLHNAGNDATYTLQALLKIAVTQTEQPGSLVKKLEELKGIKPPMTEQEKQVMERKRLAKEKKAAKRVESTTTEQASPEEPPASNSRPGRAKQDDESRHADLPPRPATRPAPSDPALGRRARGNHTHLPSLQRVVDNRARHQSKHRKHAENDEPNTDRSIIAMQEAQRVTREAMQRRRVQRDW